MAEETVRLATTAGATAAEVIVREGSEFSTVVRLGSVEKLLLASSRKIGVRIFDGRRSAVASTSDFSRGTLEALVAETLTMARAASEDPEAGLPPEEAYSSPVPELGLSFPEVGGLKPEQKTEIARRCESAALEFDPRINNSEGAGFSDSASETVYANSYGIRRSYAKTVVSLHATPLAEQDGTKQRDYWLSTHLDYSRLDSPESVGREAARRTLRRLGARKVRTCEVPVVFDPLAGSQILRHIADAVSGTFLLRKSSFLLDRLGQPVASPLVTISDDALMPGRIGSRPFDSEGIPSRKTEVVRDGILTGYLLDSYSARKLGLEPTGSSSRELSGASAAGPSNFFLCAGEKSPDEIIGGVSTGLYVTEIIGFGVNIVSGDYSQGAAGLWISGGELAYPVEEITIAGDLKDMLKQIDAVGTDLLPLGEISSPTFRISSMVVSGN